MKGRVQTVKSTKAKPQDVFPYNSFKYKHTHASFFYILSIQNSQQGKGDDSRSMLEDIPFQLLWGWGRPAAALVMNAQQGRALTSLEEKIKVCERPDRLGSATNPEMSELGLAGLESSMKEKLWNKWKQGMHLPKNNT